MADNLVTTTTVATIPSGTRVATREVTYSGEVGHVAPVGLVIIAGSDDAKTATDVSNSSPVPVSDAGTTLSVDDGGATLSIDDGGGAITVDGTVTVSGTVTVGSHAVTNAGTFAVQADSVIPGTGATNLGKAEDAVAASGDTGVVLLAVRRDAASSGVSADGDYAALSVTSDGSLRVSGSAGTTQYAEDSVAASGDSLVVVGAKRQDTLATDTSADGDYGTLKIAANGALYVTNAGSSSVFADDAAFTLTSSFVSVVGAIRDDSLSALAAAEGDAVPLRVSSTGALHVTGAGGGTQFAEDAAHTTADVGTMVLAVRRDTAAVGSGTDGDYSTINVDGSGRLWVNASGAAVPVTDNSGSLTVDNAGTFAVQVTSIAAGTNNIGDVDVLSVVPGTSATSLGKAEDAAHTTADTGVYVLAVRDDSLAAHSGTDGDYESLHTTAEGALWSTPTGSTTGGHTIFRSIDLDESEEEVKATAGTIYAIWFSNLAASTRFLKLYNATAANVTVGTTTPVITLALPGNASDDVTGSLVIPQGGIAFGTAICAAATTGVADNDTGAPGANEVLVNIFYR